jgi:pimeloyl-ACP methyl ester carboxylesterase
MNIQGKNIYLEQIGDHKDRPTIVFLHDSLGCTQLWRDFPRKICEETQCNLLVYDRIGYGKSDPMTTFERPDNYLELEADFLNELLQELKLEQVILFGHSDGGSISLIAASKYPERIKALIVEAAHIFVEDVTLKGINDARVTYNTTDLPQRLEKYHGARTEMLFKAWTETWNKASFRNWNIEAFLSKINCPLLFIQGEKDEYGSLDQVNRTVDQVGGLSEKYIIPNIGHTPHKENPEAVLEKAISFISMLKEQ